MMDLLIRSARPQLGAEELLELGRATYAVRYGHVPFLANRPQLGRAQPVLGDIFSDIGGFITGALGFTLNTLGDLVNLPLGILSQGVDIAFTGIANLLDNVPIMGPFLAQILLLGNTAIKFALSIPGLALHGLGGILMNISKALTAKNAPAENQKNVDSAKDKITSQAPPALQSAVKQALNSSGVSGQNLTPAVPPGGVPVTTPGETVPSLDSGDLSKALLIGIPAVGATAVLMLLTR